MNRKKMIYTIKAWWPNAIMEPSYTRKAHFADALDYSLALMSSGRHTTIQVLTEDNIILVALWGQPPPNMERWP
jgi:hypothetical protein